MGFRAVSSLPRVVNARRSRSLDFAVTITRPDFPRDSENGIALVTETDIPSSSNLGVQLGTATFIASFQGTEGMALSSAFQSIELTASRIVGPISANDLTLAPLATTEATLTGEIVRRSSRSGLEALGVLFTQFLQGVNQVRYNLPVNPTCH